MSLVITAPERTAPHSPSLFLAGGITGCPPWQAEVIEGLGDTDCVLFNPRRETFDVGDPSAAPEQIRWEHEMLRKADAILFWFCEESIQPIALYELGAWSMTAKPLVIGAHPNYVRRLDVVEQTLLVRPGYVIHDSLASLVTAVKELVVVR